MKIAKICAIAVMAMLAATTLITTSPALTEEETPVKLVVIDENENGLYDSGDSYFFDENNNSIQDEGEVGDQYDDSAELIIINTTCEAFEDAWNNNFSSVTADKPVFIDENLDGNLDNDEFCAYDLIAVKENASDGDTVIIQEGTIITLQTNEGPCYLLAQAEILQQVMFTHHVGSIDVEMDVDIGDGIDASASASAIEDRILCFLGLLGRWSFYYCASIDSPGYNWEYHLWGHWYTDAWRISLIGGTIHKWGPEEEGPYDLYGMEHILEQGHRPGSPFLTPSFQYLWLTGEIFGNYWIWDDETHHYEYVDDDLATSTDGHWIFCW